MEKPIFSDEAVTERLRKALALEPLDRSETDQRAKYLRRARSLPQAERIEGLIIKFYGDWQRVWEYFEQHQRADGLKLCMLFKYFLKLAFQGQAIFPISAVELAEKTWEAIRREGESDRPSPISEPLKSLLSIFVNDPVERTMSFRTGLNVFEVDDPNELIISEHHRLSDSSPDPESREYQSIWEATKNFRAIGVLSSMHLPKTLGFGSQTKEFDWPPDQRSGRLIPMKLGMRMLRPTASGSPLSAFAGSGF